RLMPTFGPGQGDGLGAKQLVQRRQPVRMDPREQVVARGRHPRRHRADEGAQFRARPFLLLRSLVSLCSLDHGGSFGPRHDGTVVLADAILTPTREPSLLSSQVQQGPGHPRYPLAPTVTVASDLCGPSD